MSRYRLDRRAVMATVVLTAAASLAVAAPAEARPAASSNLTDSYTAVGKSHIKSIDANLPIAKTNLVETLNLKNLHIVSGTLAIAPQTVQFTALGLIPIRSTTTLTQTSPITGSIKPTSKGNVLSTKVTYDIQLSNVEAQILGQWVPLGIGNDCHTITPVTIPAASPSGHYFDIAKGGVVTGTYTIGKFTGCGPLNLPEPLGSIPVNSLVPGSGNTVSITLSHGRHVSG